MNSELENKQEGLAKEGNNSDVEAKIVENTKKKKLKNLKRNILYILLKKWNFIKSLL